MNPVDNASTGPGARRRRRLLTAAVPAVVVVAAAAKLLSLAPLGAVAEGAFTGKDGSALAAAAEWLGAVNVIEPYKADFARGDAHVLRGDFAAARASFVTALSGAPERDGCRIRVNLVLSIEKLGDGRGNAGDDAGARTLYQEGLGVIHQAPPGCFEPGGEGNTQGEGGRLSDARERLGTKAGQAGNQGKDGGKVQAENPPAQQKLEQLEESERQARQDRQESEQRDEYLRSPDDGIPVERPW
ncbi:hypothetical protein [Arthrobacter celericrescens]|uniref:hypothetical protein n=1 Tax=Arthrobacter celericrescens TaxID=2320851 RepID=UPI000EA3ED1D|nr:hypothetical protein [Arthrobacter celericrescens]